MKARSKAIVVCFEAHREDGLVWAVKTGGRWTLTAAVDIQVGMRSVYRGRSATQPKAFFVGMGHVTGDATCLRITEAR